MAVKMRGFGELLADVRQLEKDLSRPEAFYHSRLPDYQLQAIKTAKEVLRFLRPPAINAREWEIKVNRVADRVSVDPKPGGDGIIFGFRGSVPADGSLAPYSMRPSSQIVSFDDIRDWIRAGMAGEAGGKRVTAVDEKVMRERGIDGVASVVMKAYHSVTSDARYTRLRAAIQRYMTGSRSTADTPLMEAVAKAWIEHFTPRIKRDLSVHAASVCRRF
ncbi:MAG: hypothetical protein EOP85_00165 [Verrucomicrobiaceae bacterium]|nr:MAG: hypothetical protein EOP85_00165 [Verrucomicrobiaceae bacterium]